MITVVNSTASVTIFKTCEKRSANHLSAGRSTTPRTLAIGATSATKANANDARLSAFVTPKVFNTNGNTKSWNRISATPPTMSTMPICDALSFNPPRSSRVLAYTGKISSYPMAMNAKTAYEEAAATVCASHPLSRKRNKASACAESPEHESLSRAIRTTTASVVTGPRSRRVSASSASSSSSSSSSSRRASVSVAFAAAPRPAGASATTACETPLSSSRTSSISGPTVFFVPKLSGSAAARSKASPSKSPSAAASTSFRRRVFFVILCWRSALRFCMRRHWLAVSGAYRKPSTPPTDVSAAAHSIGSRNGNVSKSVSPKTRGQRSAGRCRNPPMAGATHDANPNAIAKIENATVCWLFSVVSPTYVLTTPALPFRSPLRNRPARHCA